jgi:hypothetical protein
MVTKRPQLPLSRPGLVTETQQTFLEAHANPGQNIDGTCRRAYPRFVNEIQANVRAEINV